MRSSRATRGSRAARWLQLGTLGSGNHFLEVCLDEEQRVWVMLHSGSRGVGNRIGTHFISLAKKDMSRQLSNLPDKDLAYFREGSDHFEDYVFAVEWAQRFARANRELMMALALEAMSRRRDLPRFTHGEVAVNCHHNYVQQEGTSAFAAAEGAVRAARRAGIIPGRWARRATSSAVRATPTASTLQPRRRPRDVARGGPQHHRATRGSHRRRRGRKDRAVLDETPMAYKDIDAVMAVGRPSRGRAHAEAGRVRQG